MKRMITLLIAMLMAFSLAACSGTGGSAEKSSTKQNAAEQSDSSEGTLYTVTVKDQDGKGISGCVVNFCNAESCSPVTKDENGVYSYTGQPYAYHIQIVKVPDDFQYDTSKEYTAEAAGGNIDVVITRE